MRQRGWVLPVAVLLLTLNAGCSAQQDEPEPPDPITRGTTAAPAPRQSVVVTPPPETETPPPPAEAATPSSPPPASTPNAQPPAQPPQAVSPPPPPTVAPVVPPAISEAVATFAQCSQRYQERLAGLSLGGPVTPVLLEQWERAYTAAAAQAAEGDLAGALASCQQLQSQLSAVLG